MSSLKSTGVPRNLFLSAIATIAYTIFCFAIGIDDILVIYLLSQSMFIISFISIRSVISRNASIYVLVFCFYHAFLFIIPGTIHIAKNQFPFYSLPYSPEEIRSACFIILLFITSFFLGVINLGRGDRFSPKAKARVYAFRRSGLTYFFLLTLLVACIGAAYYLGLDALLSRRGGEGSSELDKALVENQLLINFTRIASFSVFVSFLLLARRKRSRLNISLAAFSSLLFVLFNLPVSIPRFYLFAYAFCIIYIFIDFTKPFYKFLLFGSMTALLLVLFPVVSIVSRGDITQISRFDPLEYYRTSGDFDGFQSTLNVVRYVDRYSITGGGQLKGTLFAFVPRSAWPDKPEPTGVMAARANGYRYTNISAPLVSEIFIDFWYGGVVLLGFLYGQFSRWIDRVAAQRRYDPTDVFSPLLIGMAIGLETIVLRGSLMSIIAPIMTTFALGFAVRFVSRVRFHSASDSNITSARRGR